MTTTLRSSYRRLDDSRRVDVNSMTAHDVTDSRAAAATDANITCRRDDLPRTTRDSQPGVVHSQVT